MTELNISGFNPTNNIKEDITKFQFYVNENFPFKFEDRHYIQFDTFVKKSNNIENLIHFLYWYDSNVIHSYRINNLENIYDQNSFHQINKILPSFRLLKIEDFNNYFNTIKSFDMNFPSEMPYELQCIKKEIDANKLKLN